MSEKTSSSGGGIGFAGLLAIVFITLKLTHVIDWSWWWVTAPLWGGAAFVIVFLLALAVGTSILAVILSIIRLFKKP